MTHDRYGWVLIALCSPIKSVQVFNYTNILIGFSNFFSNMFDKKKTGLHSETKIFWFRSMLDKGTIKTNG